MNGRFRKACALFASLAVAGSLVIVTFAAAPASAASDCETGCSFGFGAPANPLAGSFELGLEFNADIAGSINGVCYFQDPAEGGIHTVNLWTSGGALLGSGSATGVPGQTNCIGFASVPILANTTYVASYNANTNYAYNLNQFPTDVGHLHATQGRYGGPGTFPNLTTTNGYGVDVKFFTGTDRMGDCTFEALTAPTKLSSAPGDASATVSWAPSQFPPPDGCVAGYVVTPSLNGVAQTPTTIPGPGTTNVIKGLTNGGSYTFTVAAHSGFTVGPQSEATTPIVVGTATPVTALKASHARKGAVKVAFKPAHGNGAAVKTYTATCRSSNGGVARAKSGKSSPIVVTGLTPGKKYTCVVRATNSRGTGRASARSGAARA